MEIAQRNNEAGPGMRHHHHRSRRELGKLPMIETGSSKAALVCPRASLSKPTALGTIPEELSLATGPNLARKDHSRLLDTYEINVITQELCRYIESSRTKFYRDSQARVFPDQTSNRHERSKHSHDTNSRAGSCHKKNPAKGFWPVPLAVCGIGAQGVVNPGARPHSFRMDQHRPRALSK